MLFQTASSTVPILAWHDLEVGDKGSHHDGFASEHVDGEVQADSHGVVDTGHSHRVEGTQQNPEQNNREVCHQEESCTVAYNNVDFGWKGQIRYNALLSKLFDTLTPQYSWIYHLNN